MATKTQIAISVVISRPVLTPADRLSNFYHWTLHIHDQEETWHRQYEVQGEANFLSKDVIHTAPNDALFVKSIPVGYVHKELVEVLEKVVGKVEVRNEVFSWDCQDYVIEILDGLEEEGVLGEMEGYRDVKRFIVLMRGSFEDTKRQILRYDVWREGTSSMEGDDAEGESGAEDDEDGEMVEPRNVCSEEYVVDDSEDDDDGTDTTRSSPKRRRSGENFETLSSGGVKQGMYKKQKQESSGVYMAGEADAYEIDESNDNIEQ